MKLSPSCDFQEPVSKTDLTEALVENDDSFVGLFLMKVEAGRKKYGVLLLLEVP